MKVYKVKVNGKVYEVELESVSENDAKIAASEAKEVKEEVAEAPKPAPAPVAKGEGVEVKAPMQGTILNVKVAAGDQVKKGQVVAILEAMKLENEIVANADGVVKQVLVSKGQTVNNQQTLLIIG